jgi:hypothetical protein
MAGISLFTELMGGILDGLLLGYNPRICNKQFYCVKKRVDG